MTLPTITTHARTQLTIDRVNQNMLRSVQNITPQNGDVLIGMENPTEYVVNIERFLLDLYGRTDIIIGQRQLGGETPIFKKISSRFFYRLINRIGNLDIMPNAADFRLLSRQVVEGLKAMPEYHRFLRGMISWAGFKSVILPYTPKARLSGESKYTLKKMIRLAGDAIFRFHWFPCESGWLSVGCSIFWPLSKQFMCSVFGLPATNPNWNPAGVR